MTEKIISTGDKWDGFIQILKTPPKPGESQIKLRDGDGVNGEIIIWSETEGRWNFTGIRLQDIPPIPGEPKRRTSLNGSRFYWDSEKLRWCNEDFR